MAICTFNERLERAVLDELLDTIAPEGLKMAIPREVEELTDLEERTVYHVTGWLVLRFGKDMLHRKRWY
jgi:hypothetical protein